MGAIAIHFLHGGKNSFLSSVWPYAVGGAILFCLLIILFIVFKKKKSIQKTKPAKPAAPAVQAVKSDFTIQTVIQNLPKSNGQSQTLLLAASRLSDLPVTIPINLAIHLSGQGTCLLIDLDSKRDSLAKVFDVDSYGAHTYLRATPIQTSFENLSIWPARYFDLIKQINLGTLLHAASKKYDHILLYAPYLTVLADRKQIASCSKQAVVFCKQSEQQAQDHLRRILKLCNCKVLCEV